MWTAGKAIQIPLVLAVCIARVLSLNVCETTVTLNPNDQPLFLRNNQPLTTTTMIIMVDPNSTDGCWLNITERVAALHLSETSGLVHLLLASRQPIRVNVLPYDEHRFENVVLMMQLVSISIDKSNLINLVSFANLNVLIIVHGTLLSSNESTSLTEFDDTVFDNVVAFTYDGNGGSGYAIDELFDFKNDSKTYSMAEFEVRNATWNFTSKQIRSTFPFLQSLVLSGQNLSTVPMQFPYQSGPAFLPTNLSRTANMQHHYIDAEFLHTPSNVFRRVWNLDNNDIRTLVDYEFTGMLHKISLKNNQLNSLGRNTFVNITGLHNLDLSSNKIKSLPQGVFRGQDHLQKLDLDSNSLLNISSHDLEDLTGIRYLNLANNDIHYIAVNAFANMLDLMVLRLENNNLQRLDAGSFHKYPIGLQTVYLQNNSLTEFPVILFYTRGLKKACLQNNNIRFDNITEFLSGLIHYKITEAVVDSASDSDSSDLTKPSVNPVKIDLRNNNITTLSLNGLVPVKTFAFLLLHYKFDMSGNPISCDCIINSIVDNIHGLIKHGTIADPNETFKTWICTLPAELNGTRIHNVNTNETNCEVEIEKCPQECKCYRRTGPRNIIVDCRSRNLTKMHSSLPEGTLELWYNNNNITDVLIPSLVDVVDINVRNNSIISIDPTIFWTMKHLRSIDVRNNLLTTLPVSIKITTAEDIKLHPNPFECNCKTLWIKRWLAKNTQSIKDCNFVTCNTEYETGHVIVKLDDSKFVCKPTESDFDEITHVILPVTLSSFFIAVIIIFVVLVYAFRLEVKVLMYVYTGVHPFDNSSNDVNENIDCVILHSGNQTDWVMEKLVSVLENEAYRFVVCDMARDFVVGYSYSENLRKTVNFSKRMIILITPDWAPGTESFTVAWSIANEKIRDVRFDYGILVTHDVNKTDINDKDVRVFLKRGRHVDSSDKLFGDKIMYFMPRQKGAAIHHQSPPEDCTAVDIMRTCYMNKAFQRQLSRNFSENLPIDESDINLELFARNYFDVFLSYGEDEYEYAVHELAPIIEHNGMSCLIADRDFLIGASKEENILSAVALCKKTLFILSSSHVSDEWSMFTFRAAFQKSLRERTNHMLVIIKTETNAEVVLKDDEMRHYVDNYICLKETDRWFERKLVDSLLFTLKKPSVKKEITNEIDEVTNL